MRYLLMVLMLCLSALVSAQNTQSSDQIRQQMAKIRQYLSSETSKHSASSITV